MANMITRPIASAAERALSTTYLWGHTGSGPAVDRRIAMSDMVFRDGSGNVNFANNVSIQFKNTGGTDLAMINFNGSNNLLFGPSGAFTGSYFWYTGGSEIMRLSNTGILCVGRTAPIGSERVAFQRDGSAGSPVLTLNHTAASGTRYFGAFYINGVEVGSIISTGTTTAYQTSSDYRLKENIVDLEESGEFIDALRPRRGNWKADGSDFVGFIAHEFAEVFPGSVSGQKDGTEIRTVVNEETGEETEIEVPKMQGMQASSPEVMAHIISELQSLRARVAALESAAS